MTNSRSWQRLCVLPGEMRASPRPGKAIGSFESRTKDFLPSGPREGEKRGVFVCMERVACSWEESCPGCLGGRMSASEGQAFILEKRALSSSSAAHGCASPPSPPLSCLSCQVLPALLVALSPTPGHSVSLRPCRQQSSWHRRVKLEAAFLFLTSLWSFPAGKPWLLQFPTLQLIHSFPGFPKCFVGSQNTCSVNSDPGGKLAEMSFLHCNDDFVFKLQVDRIPPVSPAAPGALLQE